MNYDTLGLAAKAGVDNLMVSSALFIDADIDENYERLLKRVEG
ncbi:MAG: hypothetical protein NT091_04970 [Candidatus Falkowbacteria bacterium]|nr:hypothetical protein [Candidatus Falkowbacteria bacterium]